YQLVVLRLGERNVEKVRRALVVAAREIELVQIEAIERNDGGNRVVKIEGRLTDELGDPGDQRRGGERPRRENHRGRVGNVRHLLAHDADVRLRLESPGDLGRE